MQKTRLLIRLGASEADLSILCTFKTFLSLCCASYIKLSNTKQMMHILSEKGHRGTNIDCCDFTVHVFTNTC